MAYGIDVVQIGSELSIDFYYARSLHLIPTLIRLPSAANLTEKCMFEAIQKLEIVGMFSQSDGWQLVV